MSLVRADPIGVRPRIAAALSLLDTGQWHDAKSVLDELIKSDSKDPRVQRSPSSLGTAPRAVSTRGLAHSDDAKETKSGWMLLP